MRVRSIAFAAALLVNGAAAGGQDTIGLWPGEGCADSTVTATTGRCGLMLWRRQLLRGLPGEVVTIGQAMEPIHLSRYVRGQTAIGFARRYERQTMIGDVITFAGLAATLAQSIAYMSTSSKFQNADGTANVKKLTFFFSGIAVAGAGLPITWLGSRNGRRAVEAHNAMLRRE